MANRVVTIIYFAGSTKSSDLPLLPPTIPTPQRNDPPNQAMFHSEVAMVIPGCWFRFGLQIDINIAKLQDLEQAHNKDQEKCFMFVFSIWKALDPALVPFTWKSVIQILQKLEQNNVAKAIANQLKTC